MISKFLLIANFLIVIFTAEVSDGDRSNHQDMHRQLKVKNNYCNISSLLEVLKLPIMVGPHWSIQ